MLAVEAEEGLKGKTNNTTTATKQSTSLNHSFHCLSVMRRPVFFLRLKMLGTTNLHCGIYRLAPITAALPCAELADYSVCSDQSPPPIPTPTYGRLHFFSRFHIDFREKARPTDFGSAICSAPKLHLRRVEPFFFSFLFTSRSCDKRTFHLCTFNSYFELCPPTLDELRRDTPTEIFPFVALFTLLISILTFLFLLDRIVFFLPPCRRDLRCTPHHHFNYPTFACAIPFTTYRPNTTLSSSISFRIAHSR